jgi:hypothetical protein
MASGLMFSPMFSFISQKEKSAANANGDTQRLRNCHLSFLNVGGQIPNIRPIGRESG